MIKTTKMRVIEKIYNEFDNDIKFQNSFELKNIDF